MKARSELDSRPRSSTASTENVHRPTAVAVQSKWYVPGSCLALSSVVVPPGPVSVILTVDGLTILYVSACVFPVATVAGSAGA